MRILTSLFKRLRPTRTEPLLRINGMVVTQDHVDFIRDIKTSRRHDHPALVSREVRFECQKYGFVAMFLRPWRWAVTTSGENLLNEWDNRLHGCECMTNASPRDMMPSH